MSHIFIHIRSKLSPTLLLLTYFPPLLLLFAIISLSQQYNIPLGDFMRDPSMTADVSPFVGAISNSGALAWCAAAAVCFFSGFLLKQHPIHHQSGNFLLYFAFASTVLLIDDFFLIHEQSSSLGLSEKYIFLLYGLMIMAGFYFYWREILASDYLLFVIALGFFGASIGVDLIQGRIEGLIGEWRILFEDGFKFLGIVGWMWYFAHYGFSQLRQLLLQS